MTLTEYVRTFAERGACTCGRCFDAGESPETNQPTGHTADVYFFQVAAKEGATRDALLDTIKEHKGEFNECDLFDGKEHSYIEIGGWVGDQGLALMLMGLGTALGLWQLMTPKMLPGLDKGIMDMMAGSGMVTIQKISNTV